MRADGGERIRSRRLVRGVPGILLCLTVACAGRTSDEGRMDGSGGSGVPIAGSGNAAATLSVGSDPWRRLLASMFRGTPTTGRLGARWKLGSGVRDFSPCHIDDLRGGPTWGLMTTEGTSRRRFLEVVAAGSAAAFFLPACGSSSSGGATPTNVGDVQAGSVSAITVGTLQAVGSQPVAIGRDAGGLYAMTLTCTHQGCNIATSGTVEPSGIVCSCHGSRFDANGGVTMGPASAPLAHFAVEIDASGTVVVHTGTVVDSATRTPVA